MRPALERLASSQQIADIDDGGQQFPTICVFPENFVPGPESADSVMLAGFSNRTRK